MWHCTLSYARRQKLRCARADRDYQRYGPLHQVWRMARPMAITSANKPRGEHTVKASYGRRGQRWLLTNDSRRRVRLEPTITRDMTKGCELLADVSCINRCANVEGGIFSERHTRILSLAASWINYRKNLSKHIFADTHIVFANIARLFREILSKHAYSYFIYIYVLFQI